MANFMTRSVFTIACSPDQAATAIEAHQALCQLAISEINSILAKGDAQALNEKGKIIAHCAASHPDAGDGELTEDLEWEFVLGQQDEGLAFAHDHSINTEHAAIFAQAVLRAFDLPDLVTFTAADICDVTRANGFTGHACALTKDEIRWWTPDGFLRAETEAHTKGERYFVFTAISQAGEHQIAGQYLFVAGADQDPLALQENLCRQHPALSTSIVQPPQQIDSATYVVLRQHLATLTL